MPRTRYPNLSALPSEFDAIVVANGTALPVSLLRELTNRAKLVVALDGGANQLKRAKIAPHWVVGDLDSISKATLAWSVKCEAKIIRRASQTQSDFEKGLNFIKAKKWKRVVIASALGDRADHSLSALQTAINFRACQLTFVTASELLLPFRGLQTRTFELVEGTRLSWLPLEAANGCTLSGVRWPFRNRKMSAGGFASLSNEVTAPVQKVSQQSGNSWLVIELNPSR